MNLDKWEGFDYHTATYKLGIEKIGEEEVYDLSFCRRLRGYIPISIIFPMDPGKWHYVVHGENTDIAKIIAFEKDWRLIEKSELILSMVTGENNQLKLSSGITSSLELAILMADVRALDLGFSLDKPFEIPYNLYYSASNIDEHRAKKMGKVPGIR